MMWLLQVGKLQGNLAGHLLRTKQIPWRKKMKVFHFSFSYLNLVFFFSILNIFVIAFDDCVVCVCRERERVILQ